MSIAAEDITAIREALAEPEIARFPDFTKAVSAMADEFDRLRAQNERMRDDEAKLRGQGMAIAAGILVKGHGEETYAADIMAAAGYKSVADLEADGVDEYDINILRPLFETAALKGDTHGN